MEDETLLTDLTLKILARRDAPARLLFEIDAPESE